MWHGDSNREGALMTTSIIALVILALLYGLAWHNQPARAPIQVDDSREKRQERRR
jgi:hypothetical protein